MPDVEGAIPDIHRALTVVLAAMGFRLLPLNPASDLLAGPVAHLTLHARRRHEITRQLLADPQVVVFLDALGDGLQAEAVRYAASPSTGELALLRALDKAMHNFAAIETAIGDFVVQHLHRSWPWLRHDLRRLWTARVEVTARGHVFSAEDLRFDVIPLSTTNPSPAPASAATPDDITERTNADVQHLQYGTKPKESPRRPKRTRGKGDAQYPERDARVWYLSVTGCSKHEIARRTGRASPRSIPSRQPTSWPNCAASPNCCAAPSSTTASASTTRPPRFGTSNHD